MKPIALYVHCPFCRRKCPYCDFYSVPLVGHDSARTVAAMISELNSPRYREVTRAATIYLGGGSPSCLSVPLLEELIQAVRARFGQPEEFTVEVNPGQIDEELLDRLRELGVNRLSIGAQSLHADELTWLGRDYPPTAVHDAVAAARRAGFENIAVDLILALPVGSLQAWRETLETTLALGVEHVATYALTYEAETPLHRDLSAGRIQRVSQQADRAQYELAIDLLTAAGYEHYEISNFGRNGFPCRHNLTYWANTPYLGIGPAAGSYFQGCRSNNVADVEEYVARIEAGSKAVAEEHHPTAEEIACETAVLNLRRTAGIHLPTFQEQTGFDCRCVFGAAITEHTRAGLLRLDGESLRLTAAALPIADTVLQDFAAF